MRFPNFWLIVALITIVNIWWAIFIDGKNIDTFYVLTPFILIIVYKLDLIYLELKLIRKSK